MGKAWWTVMAAAVWLGCGGSGATTNDTDASTTDTAADATVEVVNPCNVDLALANPATPDVSTPRWAFEPWISKDISTTDDTRAFVQGCLDRQIPVGVVVLDSPWETNYHTFVPNPKRYPDFPDLVADLHAQQVRVVVWMTAQMNQASYDLEQGGDKYVGPAPGFAEGLACGHFVNKGQTFGWWKGLGASVDFFSPAARTWWNRRQLGLLEHIDGYKLDFGEMHIDPQPMQTAAGVKDINAYSQAYYREMLAFGRSRKADFVTMVRPWDASYQFAGRFFARPQDAPVAWVGDNRRDWVGLVDAFDHIFRSLDAGYPVVGSDIGGYLDRDDQDLTVKIPFDAQVFARWLAVGALGPFMQLHGRANLTPWTFPDHEAELLSAYRYWAQWHHQLAPMLFSVVRRSQVQVGAPLVMRPVPAQADWVGDWRYELGEAWLVAPLTDATDKRLVTLPAGRQWLDWWTPGQAPVAGGSTVAVDFVGDLLRTPLYLDACSVQPFVDGTPLTGLAPDGLLPHDGWLVTAAALGQRAFRLEGPQPVTATLQVANGAATLKLEQRPRPTVVAIRTPAAVSGITIDGSAAGVGKIQGGVLQGWMAAGESGVVWLGLPAGGSVTVAWQAGGD